MKLKLLLSTVILGWAASFLGAAGPAFGAPFAYVANEHSASVSQYAIGGAGELSLLAPPTVPAGAVPFGLAITPDSKSVYVVNIADNSVSEYTVNPATGELSAKTPASIAAGGGPRGITVAPDGKSAYVTNGYANANTVSQYDIDPVTGAMAPKSPATVPTGRGPLGVTVTPDGKTAYVTNFNGDAISQYDVDPTSGALSPKSPATVATYPSGAPEAVAVTPDGRSAYVANAVGVGVGQYDIDPVTGVLSPKSPASVYAGEGPSDVAVTPDGKSAYVTNANFGHGNTISQYDINPASGALTPKSPATIASGTQPVQIAVTTPPRVPTSKAQCKHGGWRRFGFKNQGQCIAFVNRH